MILKDFENLGRISVKISFLWVMSMVLMQYQLQSASHRVITSIRNNLQNFNSVYLYMNIICFA